MVLVVTTESFDMRNRHVIGYTTLRNSLSSKGILALNIGLIDKDYVGPISSVLINFGKEPAEIKIGLAFFRITFHVTRHYESVQDLMFGEREEWDYEKEYKGYYEKRKEEYRLRMDTKFLNLGKLEEEITKKVKQSILEQVRLISSLLTFGALFMTILIFFISKLL